MPHILILFRYDVVNREWRSVNIIGREPRTAIGEKGIAALAEKIDHAYRGEISLFQIIQMQFEEQRRPMRPQKRNRSFDRFVLVTFDVHFDEVRNNSEPDGSGLDALDRHVDRLRSGPHRMIEMPALDETTDGIHQHAHRSRRFADGGLGYIHSFAESI